MTSELAVVSSAAPEWQSWSYDDFVRFGREIASRSAWLYGDLACAVETSYGESTLARYAADIGVEYASLRAYKAVAEAYPQSVRRLTNSWGTHQALAAQPDRCELLANRDWTVAQARELVMSRRAPLPAPPPPPRPSTSPPFAPVDADDADDADEFTCSACWESFSVPVWHCPQDAHHWKLTDTECRNCHDFEVRPDGTVHRIGTAEQPPGDPQRGTAHVGNNSGDNEWYTPIEYIKAAAAVMGAIDLDPASSETANDIIGATRYYTEQDNGLTKPWAGRVWMNPPYAQPLISHFCELLAQEFIEGVVTEACVLVNNATETRWFHALAAVASAMCFPRGRVRFWHPDKESAPLQGQAVVYLGSNTDKFRAEFGQFGFAVTL